MMINNTTSYLMVIGILVLVTVSFYMVIAPPYASNPYLVDPFIYSSALVFGFFPIASIFIIHLIAKSNKVLSKKFIILNVIVMYLVIQILARIILPDLKLSHNIAEGEAVLFHIAMLVGGIILNLLVGILITKKLIECD